MKKVKMLIVVAMFVAIVPLVSAQHGDHSGHGQQSSGGQRMTHDQLRAAVQDICPVTGEKLGSMGAPVKAKIGQEEVFLCCEGCAKEKVDAQHWNTIHANMATAQGKCPVMGKPLPQNAKSTIVAGQTVYVCCPPCAKKIAADPKTYLQKVDALYAASVKVKPESR
jgi:YHS domain-containing protein